MAEYINRERARFEAKLFHPCYEELKKVRSKYVDVIANLNKEVKDLKEKH